MRRCIDTFLVLAASMALAQAARADDEKLVPEEGAVQVMLLRQKSVRDELKLTEAECKKIDEFSKQQWRKAESVSKLSEKDRDQKFEEMTKENERFLHETLEPDQQKRLDQITLQLAGLLWVTRSEVASKLKLSAEQKQKATELQKKAREEMEELVHATRSEKRQEKFRELRTTSRQKLLALLTPQQQNQWNEMTGKPFSGTIDLSDPTGDTVGGE